MDEEKYTLAEIMNVLIKSCDDCPLERVCKGAICEIEWYEFFMSKIKTDGLDSER